MEMTVYLHMNVSPVMHMTSPKTPYACSEQKRLLLIPPEKEAHGAIMER
jgi:hypothetical protein